MNVPFPPFPLGCLRLPAALRRVAALLSAALLLPLAGHAQQPPPPPPLPTPAPPAGTVQFASTVGYTVVENAGVVVLSVTRTGGSVGVLTVQYQTLDGTAINGSDYVGTSGTLVFADGDTTPKFFSVSILDDATAEPAENFSVVLTATDGVTVLGDPSQTTVIIQDDDSSSTLQFGSATFTAFESDTGAIITVTRNAGPINFSPVTVDYITSDGTAHAGVNYTPVTGTLFWQANDFTPKTFTVPLLRDGQPTPNLTVQLSLSAPSSSAGLGNPSTATLTIIDVDSPAVLQFSAPEYLVTEDSVAAVVNVTRTGGAGTAVGVAYTTQDGSARAGLRYQGVNGTLFWAAGDTSDKSIVIPLINDTLPQQDETVGLLLGQPQGNAVIGAQGQATLIIRDDEAGNAFPFVTIGATGPVAFADGSRKGAFTVTREGGNLGTDLIVHYLVRGTAANGLDYRLLGGVVLIPAGSETAMIKVKAINGGGDGQGTVKLILRAGDGYFVGDADRAKVRIVTSLPSF